MLVLKRSTHKHSNSQLRQKKNESHTQKHTSIQEEKMGKDINIQEQEDADIPTRKDAHISARQEQRPQQLTLANVQNQ